MEANMFTITRSDIFFEYDPEDSPKETLRKTSRRGKKDTPFLRIGETWRRTWVNQILYADRANNLYFYQPFSGMRRVCTETESFLQREIEQHDHITRSISEFRQKHDNSIEEDNEHQKRQYLEQENKLLKMENDCLMAALKSTPES
jgi:hypothetical protein